MSFLLSSLLTFSYYRKALVLNHKIKIKIVVLDLSLVAIILFVYNKIFFHLSGRGHGVGGDSRQSDPGTATIPPGAGILSPHQEVGSPSLNWRSLSITLSFLCNSTLLCRLTLVRL